MADEIRKAAMRTLMESDGYPSRAVRRTIGQHRGWTHRDGAFYAALVEAAVGHLTTIDAILSAYSTTRLKKLRPQVLASLRLAVAQIFYMDRVPDRSATDEAVELVKAGGAARYAGFVNAVLRQIIREKDSPSARVVDGNTSIILKYKDGSWRVCDRRYSSREKLLDTALRTSYPLWIADFLEKSYPGKKVLEGLCAERQVTAISKASAREIADFDRRQGQGAGRSVGERLLSGGIYELTFGSAEGLSEQPSFKAGLFYIMDRSSMEPLLEADLPQGCEVLDLCASPGGKSVCAALLHGARVLSCDISESKLARIEENIERLGLRSQIRAQVNDASVRVPSWEGQYGAVIADCPCSGLGVSGRKPEIRLRVSESDLEQLAALQAQILSNAASYLRGGGTLIYSTCTLDPKENEEQVAGFIRDRQDFTIEKQRTIVPDEGHDGFYYCIMRKAAD